MLQVLPLLGARACGCAFEALAGSPWISHSVEFESIAKFHLNFHDFDFETIADFQWISRSVDFGT